MALIPKDPGSKENKSQCTATESRTSNWPWRSTFSQTLLKIPELARPTLPSVCPIHQSKGKKNSGPGQHLRLACFMLRNYFFPSLTWRQEIWEELGKPVTKSVSNINKEYHVFDLAGIRMPPQHSWEKLSWDTLRVVCVWCLMFTSHAEMGAQQDSNNHKLRQ